jgi:hypothetical protein
MAARSTSWPRQAHTYRLPELLTDIRLLDLLELSGSTHRASQVLELSQPSVSRRYRALAEDFELRAEEESPPGWRYGTNATMRLLRLSCRCHRLQAGVARLGADLLHHSLLDGLPWLLPAPLRFRPLRDWFELVRHGVLDGALVSELELERESALQEPELELHRLGPLPLSLARATAPDPSDGGAAITVLVPGEAIAPGLRALLNRQGMTLRIAGPGCATPEQWRDQLRRRGGAMPVGGRTGPAAGWAEHLEWRPLADGTVSPVWLALPRGSDSEPLLRHTLERLRAAPALAG